MGVSIRVLHFSKFAANNTSMSTTVTGTVIWVRLWCDVKKLGIKRIKDPHYFVEVGTDSRQLPEIYYDANAA